MGCTCASLDTDSGRYTCSVTDCQCLYLIPNSKACAETYGEGPDVERED